MSRGTGSPPPMAGGTDFPAHLTVLEQMRDLASVKESLYELTTNMEHQSTLGTPPPLVWCS